MAVVDKDALSSSSAANGKAEKVSGQEVPAVQVEGLLEVSATNEKMILTVDPRSVRQEMRLCQGLSVSSAAGLC